ncbi:MAG: adenosine deaminase [Halieaceae bacterium]|jgi:adenosine deaminase|nr:adenosine deaminase [Halieaceae bacterium]
MNAVADAAFIRNLPKLELHIHLEGSIPLARIEAEAAQRGIAPPRPYDQLFVTEDLSDFLETLDWVCGLFVSADQLQRLAHDFAVYCREQGMVYCEVIVNPTHWGNFDLDTLLPTLSDAFDAASDICDVRILPSILRTQSGEEALALVEWIGEAHARGLARRVIGLSVDGNEQVSGPTGERFAPAYNRAAELGLGLTSHAGESSGAEGVQDALDHLKIHRLDHGVRAIEDPALVQRLAREGITLNVCVSSNCVRLYPGPESHPFPALLEAGVPVTVNTDDPVVLNTTLCDELVWLVEHYDLTPAQLLSLQRTAVEASFCDARDKAALHAALDKVEA